MPTLPPLTLLVYFYYNALQKCLPCLLDRDVIRPDRTILISCPGPDVKKPEQCNWKLLFSQIECIVHYSINDSTGRSGNIDYY